MKSLLQTLQAFDQAAFAKVNSLWINPALDRVMPFITDAKNTNLLLGLVAALLILRYRWYGAKAILAALIAIGLTDVIAAQVIKPLVARDRPAFALSDVRLLVPTQGSPSFPSNHAANCFAGAVTLSAFFPALTWPALLIASAVAYSRIYVGVHFPLDTLAGLLLGSVVAFFISKIFQARLKNV